MKVQTLKQKYNQKKTQRTEIRSEKTPVNLVHLKIFGKKPERTWKFYISDFGRRQFSGENLT